MFLWKKKIGAVHIAYEETTACGIPMLGNNYATQGGFATCFDCIDVDKKKNPKNYKTKKKTK